MFENISYNRRHFLGWATTVLAGASLALGTDLRPRSKTTGGSTVTFDRLKQIDAGVLNVGYAEDGPPSGPPVLLLHGWPYDIYCYADAAKLLASNGYRVVVPFLRGYGTTHFLSRDTP